MYTYIPFSRLSRDTRQTVIHKKKKKSNSFPDRKQKKKYPSIQKECIQDTRCEKKIKKKEKKKSTETLFPRCSENSKEIPPGTAFRRINFLRRPLVPRLHRNNFIQTWSVLPPPRPSTQRKSRAKVFLTRSFFSERPRAPRRRFLEASR